MKSLREFYSVNKITSKVKNGKYFILLCTNIDSEKKYKKIINNKDFSSKIEYWFKLITKKNFEEYIVVGSTATNPLSAIPIVIKKLK